MRLSLIFIFLMAFCVKAKCQKTSASDSIFVVNNISLFKANLQSKPILRTYSIKFSIYKRSLDTNDRKTIAFLDSLVEFMKTNENVVLEVGVHLSIKHSSEYSKRYDCMYLDILKYLKQKGVKSNRLIGKNYLDSQPIVVNTNGEKKDKFFWDREWEINNRVEFKLVDN